MGVEKEGLEARPSVLGWCYEGIESCFLLEVGGLKGYWFCTVLVQLATWWAFIVSLYDQLCDVWGVETFDRDLRPGP